MEGLDTLFRYLLAVAILAVAGVILLIFPQPGVWIVKHCLIGLVIVTIPLVVNSLFFSYMAFMRSTAMEGLNIIRSFWYVLTCLAVAGGSYSRFLAATQSPSDALALTIFAGAAIFPALPIVVDMWAEAKSRKYDKQADLIKSIHNKRSIT